MNVTAIVTQGAMSDIAIPTYPAGVPLLESRAFDLESLLPLSLIRTHTKSDDVPNVTDEQLVLYRRAAFEACERYTGRLFTEIKVVTENAAHANRGRMRRDHYKLRLRYRSVDGLIYLYGGAGGRTQVIRAEPGTREIRVPVVLDVLDGMGACCDPCGSGRNVNHGLQVMYRAGYDCSKDAVPAGILVGCLKFIAWSVQNPGDEILTVRNRQSSESTGIIGTNNGAWASGAIEQWRIYVDEI